jgi:hypothetical protein
VRETDAARVGWNEGHECRIAELTARDITIRKLEAERSELRYKLAVSERERPEGVGVMDERNKPVLPPDYGKDDEHAKWRAARREGMEDLARAIGMLVQQSTVSVGAKTVGGKTYVEELCKRLIAKARREEAKAYAECRKRRSHARKAAGE